MIDCKTHTDPFSYDTTTYYFKYSFRNMPYLKCDKFGNMFLLPHYSNKRTVNFKHLDKSKGYVYYNRNMVRISTLKQRVIKEFSIFTQ